MEHASAIDFAAAIRRKELSPTAGLETTLAAVERYDHALDAVICP